MRTNLDEIKKFLNSEFSKRKTKNPAFSKNAFAKKLGVPSTTLNEFLIGKRELSFKNLNSIFKYINSDIHCSFCDKHKSETPKMIAGPRNLYICDSCIDRCNEIRESNSIKKS